MSFQIPDGDSLVSYIKDFTGSTNTAEIKQCIFLAEMAMRNIELPALRSDPYAPESWGVADSTGAIPIPPDMNKPILFFNQNNAQDPSQSNQAGPWIVYDRIGDRDIIGLSMIAQIYLQPVNVPFVIRGKFSEVGQKYKFLPVLGEGEIVNLYYYKAWPLLFSPVEGGFPGQTVQKNAVLQTWPEGYVYATLQYYYAKRHNQDDAAMYKGLYDDAWRQVEDQNNKGKWSGGHTRLTSIFQPRKDRMYAVK